MMPSARRLNILKKRKDFLAVRNANKHLFKGKVAYACPFFLVQKRPHPPSPKADLPSAPCFGFTVSKKNGNAVVRNRIKRRLKEAVRTHIDQDRCTGYDYVIIAKPQSFSAPFTLLIGHLEKGLYALQ